MSLTHAAVYRNRAFDFSPWVEQALAGVGVTTSGLTLPKGYRISGLARRPSGPFTLTLHTPHPGTDPGLTCRSDDLAVSLASLVDLAYVDAREHADAPELCIVCQFRPGDAPINLGGRIAVICDTCQQRREA